MSGVEIKPAASEAEVAAIRNDPSFTEYGGGAVDLSDLDYPRQNYLFLPANVPVRMARDLAPTGANYALNRPFTGWQPWDNDAKLIRPRAFHDKFTITAAMRVVADQIGGVLTVNYQVNLTLSVGVDLKPLSRVGVEEPVTSFLEFFVRPSFLRDGAQIILTCTVPAVIREFSPIVSPLGYEA